MPTHLPSVEEATSRILSKRLPLAEELARRSRAIEAAEPPATSSPGVIVTDDASRELFARVARFMHEEEELAFFAALDQAMGRALARKDGRVWLTQTMKRFRCRLHFLRAHERTFLVACVPLDDEDDEKGSYST